MVNKLPAKMTSMVEHQRARGCFLEKGSEPGEYDHCEDDNRVDDDDGDPDDDGTMMMRRMLMATMMMMVLPLARSSLTARQQRAA